MMPRILVSGQHVANTADQTQEEPERTARQWMALQLNSRSQQIENNNNNNDNNTMTRKTSLYVGRVGLDFDNVRSVNTTAEPKPVKTQQILMGFSLKLLAIGASRCMKQYLTRSQPGLLV